MTITNISVQVKNQDRVNVSVDGKYRFSLDVFQVGELGLKVGIDYTDQELTAFETESQFGKLYSRALEYSVMRPHSVKEVRDYLWRKTRDTKYKSRDGEIKDRAGVSQAVADRVLDRLTDKGYVNDENFTRHWVENRNQTKGVSRRKLTAELRAKGVDQNIISAALDLTERDDTAEIQKVIAKKARHYPDQQKLIMYLMRQGFRFDDIKTAITTDLLD